MVDENLTIVERLSDRAVMRRQARVHR